MSERDMIARRELREAGVTDEQMNVVTGMGRRSLFDSPMCGTTDTVLTKYAAGALSIYGVMAVLFGTDSPQHHAGKVTP